MLNKQVIYVTGLPRSGSTLLCQLLDHHSNVYSTGHSSPLCQVITGLRTNLSDSNFLLSQLDVDFELGYQRLLNAFCGFMNGWFAETNKPCVVDKNRGWLQHLELLFQLDPNCRILVCVRELGQIYGSIEAQHQKTQLLDFPDKLADLSRSARAKSLFAEQGVVGGPLQSLESIQDLEESLQKHLYYVVFEHLIADPEEVLQGICSWLQLSRIHFDPQNLKVKPHESDSYYRFKYSHETFSRIQIPKRHTIPQRFDTVLKQNFSWYYETFYPGLA